MNSHIKNIISREILDSRGNPTVEVDIILENNTMGRAAVPSGASTGEFEAMELRDNDKTRYIGKGVLTAVNNINDEINKALVGVDVIDQLNIDEITMYFEFSFREREPYDSQAIKDIKESVKYWRKYIGRQNN